MRSATNDRTVNPVRLNYSNHYLGTDPSFARIAAKSNQWGDPGKIAAGFSNPLRRAERSERVAWTAAALHPGATIHALGARADLVKQTGSKATKAHQLAVGRVGRPGGGPIREAHQMTDDAQACDRCRSHGGFPALANITLALCYRCHHNRHRPLSGSTITGKRG